MVSDPVPVPLVPVRARGLLVVRGGAPFLQPGRPLRLVALGVAISREVFVVIVARPLFDGGIDNRGMYYVNMILAQQMDTL